MVSPFDLLDIPHILCFVLSIVSSTLYTVRRAHSSYGSRILEFFISSCIPLPVSCYTSFLLLDSSFILPFSSSLTLTSPSSCRPVQPRPMFPLRGQGRVCTVVCLYFLFRVIRYRFLLYIFSSPFLQRVVFVPLYLWMMREKNIAFVEKS